jgi:hypothetical protein
LRIETRVGDVRNSLTIKYGSTSSAEESASNAASIAQYGTLAQIITTTLEHSDDATARQISICHLRAQPQPIFSEITFDLTNPEIDDTDRDALINVFMGEAIALQQPAAEHGVRYVSRFCRRLVVSSVLQPFECHPVIVPIGLFIAGNALE